ncbi:hypothetical protein, partial [Shewanella algae]|uniref:hypothetical protein n=1 Tax=Shewanella algae TaxID=38313 RepID=UPI00313E701F
RVLPQVRHWSAGGPSRRSYVMTWTSRTSVGDGWVEETQSREMRPAPHTVFTDALVEETIERLGTVAELLSTPSFADGSITIGDLAHRLENADRGGV